MKNGYVLIADDDQTLCYLLKEELINEGYQVDITFDGKYAIEKLKTKTYDLLLLDLEMKNVQGEEVLKYTKTQHPTLQVIVLTAKTEVRTAIQCIKDGAYDFITKPYEFGQLVVIIERALEHKNLLIKNKLLKSKVEKKTLHSIIGESTAIKMVLSLAERAAKSESPILLEGDTGTGKELFAEFIHQHSNMNNKPFVAINCASLPDALFESELFGHEKGAFTDAKTSKQGLVEMANGGTLFLDEIGELSLAIQPKLLRFLENGEFRRVGGVTNLSSDVRIIGATNKNLMDEADKKNFRRDLLFRLNVITLKIPPLNKRGHDVILLAKYFLQKKSSVRSQKFLSNEAEKALMQYSFPGNVRELEHIIERSIIFSTGEKINTEELNIQEERHDDKKVALTYAEHIEMLTLTQLEELHIRKILSMNNWRREKTANILGITPKTLYLKIKKYNITQ